MHIDEFVGSDTILVITIYTTHAIDRSSASRSSTQVGCARPNSKDGIRVSVYLCVSSSTNVS